MARPRFSRNGFTLVEMMVALALGLLLMLGISGIYFAQRQTWQLTENLARMQDSSRIASELLARDVREAGGTPCGRVGIFTNQLSSSDAQSPWLRWPGEHGITEGGLVGYRLGDASYGLPAEISVSGPVNGTDALLLRTASHQVLDYMNAGESAFTFVGAAHGFNEGDVLMACDHERAMLFKVSSADGNKVEYDVDLSSAFDGAFSDGFNTPGLIGKLTASLWLVLDNNRGGRSLYRITGPDSNQTQEIAEGITDMQIRYLTTAGNGVAPDYLDILELAGSGYVDSTNIWRNAEGNPVIAVQIALTLESKDKIGADGEKLQRTQSQIISLRHRERLNGSDAGGDGGSTEGGEGGDENQ